MAIADHSLLNNQMLVCRDNAWFAWQAIGWLNDDNRRVAMLVVDGRVTLWPLPAEVELIPPPPTQEEVMALLENLPPELLVEFGNLVTTVVEDEGILNEAITGAFTGLPRHHFFRCLVLAATGILGVLVLGRLWRRSHHPGHHLSRPDPNRDRAAERREAAQAMYDQFCLELAAEKTEANPLSPRASHRRVAGELHRFLARTESRLSTRHQRYWSSRRLARLANQLHDWRQSLGSSAPPY